MSAAVGVIAPAIKVDGTALPAEWVTRLSTLQVDRCWNVMGRASLTFVDEGYKLATQATFRLGKAVTIGLPDGTTLFAGDVTGVHLAQNVRRSPRLTVIVHDRLHRLADNTHAATYLQSTYADVIRTMVSKAGLQSDVTQTKGGPREYHLQAGSDLEHLTAIANRIGLVFGIDPAKPSSVWVRPLGTVVGRHSVTYGEQLLELSVEASALRPTDVTVVGWDPDRQDKITGQAASAEGVTTAAGDLVDPFHNPAAAVGQRTSSTSTGQVATAEEASVAASAAVNRVLTDAVSVRGVALVDAAIEPGTELKVTDSGPASGTYLVSRVEHVFGLDGFRTRFHAGRQRPAGLVDTLVAPRAHSVPGLVPAVVTDVNDPEKLGRVMIRYAGLADEVGSPWARVVSAGGGSKRGSVFLPEVGDEVIVGFERGDPDRPIVLGGLYSKKNPLPEWSVENGQVTARRITSRSGHLIEFSDGTQPDKSHILIQLATASHKIRVGQDRLDVAIEAGKPLTIAAGSAKFDIDAQGNVTIAGKQVTIKSEAALSVESGADLTLKATGQAALQGLTTSVKANGQGQVEAGGILAVKGTMVTIN